VASGRVGHLHGAWPVTKQAALLRRLAIMAVNCHRLQGVMWPVRSWCILALMMLHFLKRARSFAAAQPSVETHLYNAGHGFNCDHRGQYDADAAALA
jgi:hypothetical protein